jgi:hypothetical protein
MLNNLRNSCKACALIAAVVLPSLAYADHRDIDWGKSWDHGKDWDRGRDRGHKDPPVSSVPEASTGWVLVPVLGAILLVSSVRLFKARKA